MSILAQANMERRLFNNLKLCKARSVNIAEKIEAKFGDALSTGFERDGQKFTCTVEGAALPKSVEVISASPEDFIFKFEETASYPEKLTFLKKAGFEPEAAKQMLAHNGPQANLADTLGSTGKALEESLGKHAVISTDALCAHVGTSEQALTSEVSAALEKAGSWVARAREAESTIATNVGKGGRSFTEMLAEAGEGLSKLAPFVR